jgi:hypothetical protein
VQCPAGFCAPLRKVFNEGGEPVTGGRDPVVTMRSPHKRSRNKSQRTVNLPNPPNPPKYK